jgi:heat shock protein HslJ
VLRGVAALVMVLAIAGCSDADDGSSSSSTRPAPGTTLEGTDWVLLDVAELAPGATGVVTAVFADGTVTGESACNRYRAPYHVAGPRLTIGPEIAGTAMACPEGQLAAEQAYRTRLTEVARHRITNGELVLEGSDAATLLTFGASDARGLLGAWEVTGYYSGDAIRSPIPDTTLTARFGAEEVAGNGGCNQFSGPVRIDGETIAIGPLGSTLVACEDPERTTQEQQYLEALQGAASYRATGDRLELLRGDGGIAVTFDRGAVAG